MEYNISVRVYIKYKSICAEDEDNAFDKVESYIKDKLANVGANCSFEIELDECIELPYDKDPGCPYEYKAHLEALK